MAGDRGTVSQMADGIMEGFERKLRDLLERLGMI